MVTPATDSPKEGEEPSQDPVKQELEKEERKAGGKSELEKLQFTKKKLLERETELLKEQGVEPTIPDNKDVPLTVGMYEQLQKQNAQRTALQLAEDIADDHERELAKHYLKTRVVPTGNPQEDLRFALAAVNSVRNGMIAEEVARRGTPSHGTGGGAPARKPEGVFTPTADEAAMMKPPFNLSQEQIIAARKAAEASQ